jgi:hypothetical protein
MIKGTPNAAPVVLRKSRRVDFFLIWLMSDASPEAWWEQASCEILLACGERTPEDSVAGNMAVQNMESKGLTS